VVLDAAGGWVVRRFAAGLLGEERGEGDGAEAVGAAQQHLAAGERAVETAAVVHRSVLAGVRRAPLLQPRSRGFPR
jgi:hypothetical protein